jgi:hypothetical protein
VAFVVKKFFDNQMVRTAYMNLCVCVSVPVHVPVYLPVPVPVPQRVMLINIYSSACACACAYACVSACNASTYIFIREYTEDGGYHRKASCAHRGSRILSGHTQTHTDRTKYPELRQ